MIKNIVVYILSAGVWAELIRMPLENPEEATPKDIDEALEAVRDMFYKANKVHLLVPGTAISVKGLEDNFSAVKVVAE